MTGRHRNPATSNRLGEVIVAAAGWVQATFLTIARTLSGTPAPPTVKGTGRVSSPRDDG